MRLIITTTTDNDKEKIMKLGVFIVEKLEKM